MASPPRKARSGKGPPGRRRRSPRRGDRPKGPLLEQAPLDLSKPKEEPLSREELRIMTEHLAFLRRFKGLLRLSLNAQEDLIVNGARPPTDRGLVRHLLSKVDRATVQKALARDPIRGDPRRRAELLAGLVRIDPDPTLLLSYLDTLAELPERRAAAQAFGQVVDRIDFAQLSNAQMSQLLGVIRRTFEGPDQVQVFWGLLDSPSFRSVLGRLFDADPTERVHFAALAGVHRIVSEGGSIPADDADTRELERGVRALLSSPSEVLASYPEPIRARLVELAQQVGGTSMGEPLRRLLDTLPQRDESYVGLRLERIEQLLRTKQLEEAKKLLGRVKKNQPDLDWASDRLEALGWARAGEVTVAPGTGRLRRGFWLRGNAFVLVRAGTPLDAARLNKEARFQGELIHPSIAPVLCQGLAEDGRPYLAIPDFGGSVLAAKRLRGRLSAALQVAQLLAFLADRGILLPDLEERRFLIRGDEDPHLLLADFDGAQRDDPAQAGIRYAELGRALCRKILEAAGTEDSAPEELGRKLARPTPLPVLVRALVDARLDRARPTASVASTDQDAD